MFSIPLEDAQARLDEIIAGLLPGEEIEITKDNQPVARLIGELPPPRAAETRQRDRQDFHHLRR